MSCCGDRALACESGPVHEPTAELCAESVEVGAERQHTARRQRQSLSRDISFPPTPTPFRVLLFLHRLPIPPTHLPPPFFPSSALPSPACASPASPQDVSTSNTKFMSAPAAGPYEYDLAKIQQFV